MKKISTNTLFIAPIIVSQFVALFIQAQPSQDLANRMMPKPVPASPNVASLGKFGDYQVSHFTDIPEISIPIFELQSGSLSIPITLSYHAGGNKPTDVASWVGLGWALSTGGQISRSVNGKMDEEHYSSNALNLAPRICETSVSAAHFYYLQYAATRVTDNEINSADGEQSSPTVKEPPHDQLFKEVTVEEAGYAYIFLSNEHTTYVDNNSNMASILLLLGILQAKPIL